MKKVIILKFKTRAKPVTPTPTPVKTPTPTPTDTPSPTPTAIVGTTVNNDAELSAALSNLSISTLIFNASYTYKGFTVRYPVYIVGNGAAVNSKMTISSSNVTVDNLNVTAGTNATGAFYNIAYQISENKSGIVIKNGSVNGTLSKYNTKGIVFPASMTTEVRINNVNFNDLGLGIAAGMTWGGLTMGGILSLTDSTFTNCYNAIGKTENCTLAELKNNTFYAGCEGIGLGEGIKVTIPGQDIWSLENYLRRVNRFLGYIDYKDVADYRSLTSIPSGYHTPTPAPTPKPTTLLSPTPTISPLPTPSDTYKVINKIQSMASSSPDGKAHILFLGNSLTYAGNLPQYISSLLNGLNLPVTVGQYTPGGHVLSQIYSELLEPSRSKIITNKDIVIIQGYQNLAFNIVPQIEALFDEDTEFYYLVTEFDLAYTHFLPMITNYSDIVGNLKYIPSGYTYNQLLTNGFTIKNLLAIDGQHPTAIYGYFSACTAYSTIFDTTCIGLPYSFLDKETMAIFPGATDSDKALMINKGQESVMEAMKTILPPNS